MNFFVTGNLRVSRYLAAWANRKSMLHGTGILVGVEEITKVGKLTSENNWYKC